MSLAAGSWLFVYAIQYFNGTHKKEAEYDYWGDRRGSSAASTRRAFSFIVAPIAAFIAVFIVSAAGHWAPQSAEAEASFYEENEELFDETLISMQEGYKYCNSVEGRNRTGLALSVEEGFDVKNLAKIATFDRLIDRGYDGNVWILVHPESKHGGYGNPSEQYLLRYSQVDKELVKEDTLFMYAKESTGEGC